MMIGRPSRFFSEINRVKSCVHDCASFRCVPESEVFAWSKICCEVFVIDVGGLLRLDAPNSLEKKILEIARASLKQSDEKFVG